MKENDQKLLEHCINHRKEGKYFEIVESLNTLLKKHPQSALVVEEILKLCILLGEFERAYQFYQKLLKLTGSNVNIEPEVLMRLHIGLKNIPLPGLDKIDFSTSSQWCQAAWESGNEVTVGFEINDVSVISSDGTVNYIFSGACGSCGHTSIVELYRTFLVRREILCPVCFANQLFDYEGIKIFIQKNYQGLLNEKVYALDERLRKIQYKLNVDSVKGDSFSKISKYLNQDYVFILNQFLVSRLVEQQ